VLFDLAPRPFASTLLAHTRVRVLCVGVGRMLSSLARPHLLLLQFVEEKGNKK
jgi:hypothetical protein